MKVTYKCECGNIFTVDVKGKPDFNHVCDKCNSLAPRNFGTVAIDHEPENVSGAIQLMIHSKPETAIV